jgi:dTDP-glucose pyrophosphorylase
MTKPVLVIMAAGMGSRFGGLKQIAPVDEQGHIIMDFSLFDAWRAGFRDLVFIVKPELEESFREAIGNRMEKYFNITYVHQTIDKLPAGYGVPEGRVKPWGTGHAILCCKDVVKGPFTVINADDFYGPSAFSTIYDYLVANEDPSRYAMVGYRVRNTVTENGSVARGVCEIENGLLTGVTERTKIFKNGTDAKFTEDGETFVHIPGDTIVSMNFWGFTARMLQELDARFAAFLDDAMVNNPLKGEYFLPSVVNEQLQAGTASVRVLPCEETWHGVTYREDLDSVKEAIAGMKQQGIYEENLWN